ncbi:rCG42643 [Rattus norvegicus]|uniref:RCG42643 n=1 Tax=Rattus norvegicus TaxID=10116 RepID=A6K1H2_RAT|nr:rCG42643 [Rattus norvegicus]
MCFSRRTLKGPGVLTRSWEQLFTLPTARLSQEVKPAPGQ